MNTMRRDRDRRWQLRDATASEHEELDGLTGQFTDRDAYAAYLSALHQFRAPIERAVAHVRLGDYRPTLLAHLLERDLGDLGIPLQPANDTAPPRGSHLMGTLYVLEGAALGGQILRKRAGHLGFDADNGARHLAGGTSGWQAFLAQLDLADPYDPDLAAAAGRATFASARDAFLKAHR